MTFFNFAVTNFCGWTILTLTVNQFVRFLQIAFKILTLIGRKKTCEPTSEYRCSLLVGGWWRALLFLWFVKETTKIAKIIIRNNKKCATRWNFLVLYKAKTKCGTWFATFLQNELIRDVARFTTHFRTCLAKFFFVGGEKRNSAFQLVLQQSRKISFTFSVCCPFYRPALKTTEL